jgi:hypothetical protein
MTWDVTIPDTLAQSHLPKTSCVSGAAAEDASLRKIAKYTGVRQGYDFTAIAVETLGPMNEDGLIFCWKLAGGYRQYRVTSAKPASSFKGFL